jgi:hypothetical protein
LNLTSGQPVPDRNDGTCLAAREGENMLDRHCYLGLGLVLLVATTNAASAAEETVTRNPKPCGGYYACIEVQPSQPDSILDQGKFTDPKGARP